MQKIADFIVKHKIIILIVFALMMIGSIFTTIFLTNINSDITSYLPSDSDTAKGQRFLMDNFNIKGDIIIAIGGKTEDEVEAYLTQINNIEVIKGEKAIASINWIGSDSFAFIKTTLPDKFAEIENVFVKTDGNGNKMYAIFIMMNYIPSTKEADDVLDEVHSILKDTDYAVNGSSQMTKSIMDETVGEIGKYTVVGVIIVLLILILTTQSFMEPLVLLLTLSASIIINMGTNFIYKEVSIITYSAASILQLGMSMDYAIFLIHRYRQLRDSGLDCKQASRDAIPYTFASIAASALTTVGGFAALYFMRFSIGADLGKVLIKGIILSLVTVIVLQPCLIIIFNKVSEKTTHKYLNLKFNKETGFVMRHRWLFVIVAVICFVPSLILQSKLEFNYLKFQAQPKNPTETYSYAEKMTNQIMLAVPIKTEEIDKQYEFLSEIKADSNIEFVLGLCVMIEDPAMAKGLLSLNSSMISQYVNNGYTLYTVGLNKPIESEEAIASIANFHSISNKYFGDDYKMTGTAQAVSDFAAITPRDFNIVSIISIVIVFIVLLFTLKNLKLSVLLIILIEFGIWINLGISYLTTGNINFMSYIIISSIQLGATVDYAILTSTEYLKNRKKGMHPENAAFNAVTSSAMAVITSASILMGACLSVYFLSSNLIVAEITLLIARGAGISCLLVLLVLPTVLTVTSNIWDRINSFRNNGKSSNNGENANT